MNKPAVILNPDAQNLLQAGFFELAHLLSLTLGPTQGAVLVDSETKERPDLLTDAATIARRIIALPERGRDVGAMLLRQTVWRSSQREGDGTALTAVIAQAILKEATKMIAAGANPMMVQRGVRQAVDVAREALKAQARPVNSDEDLTAVAQAVTGHRALSVVLGELYDLLGAEAHIIIEDFMAPLIERTYLDGGRWEGNLISPFMHTTKISKKAIQTNCRVALYQERLHEAEDVEPLLELMIQNKQKKLLLVAVEIKGAALETLVLNHTNEETPLSITAVALPAGGERGREDLADLAVLTGATSIGSHIGRQLRHIQLSDLGIAGRVEASNEAFFVMQGGGNRAVRQREIEGFKARLGQMKIYDEDKKRLQMRLSRLTGNAAILKIGATTKAERTHLHQKAEQGIKALAATVDGGYLLGGGLALLNCKTAVLASIDSLNGDERMGATAVFDALDMPAICILKNAGVSSPESILSQLDYHPEGTIYDVLTGQYKDAYTAGIVDPLRVVLSSLESGASGAMLALSIETIVLNKKPEMSYDP
ncbi:MAG: TCP-1/cpn60 chaperonin family protein [Chloroflexota bacterium]